jgi:uncharacterized protein YidB (DUF937 family)
MPSERMIALLGLLAVAGYQNRDRIKEMLGNIGQGGLGSVPGLSPTPSAQPGAGSGGLGGLLGGLLGRGGIGQNLHGGLSDLIEHMTGNGQSEAAKSWVQNGPNRELNASELESALGTEAIGQLTSRTGLSRDDLLARLKTVLPTAVDQMTPEGRLPSQAEASNWSKTGGGQTA